MAFEPEGFAIDKKKQIQGKGLEMTQEPERGARETTPIRGLAGWLLGRLHGLRRTPPRLAVLERITLAPRQSLALVEAEGRRFLVATSPEGTPVFYPLDAASRAPARPAAMPQKTRRKAARAGADRAPRVSW
jgi:hypothetical protein